MVKWFDITSLDELARASWVRFAPLLLSLVFLLSVRWYVDTVSHRLRRQNLQ